MRKRQARLRVGVVEPDDDLRQLLLEMFEDEGFDVCVASDWKDLPSSCRPDVIVTESENSTDEGQRVAQRVELRRDGSSSQVLLLSDGVRTLDDVAELEGATVVSKPFDVDELLALMPALARRGRSAAGGSCTSGMC